MNVITGFRVSDFEDIPIVPDGYIRKQGRDKDGRFNYIVEYVPDPNYKPDYSCMSRVYLLDDEQIKAMNLRVTVIK